MSAPTAMLNATCSLAVRQRSVATWIRGSWIHERRNAKLSRTCAPFVVVVVAPFVLARRAARISKTFDRKPDPPKLREENSPNLDRGQEAEPARVCP